MKLVKFISYIMVIYFLSGCTSYVILFKPPKTMDPVPKADVEKPGTTASKESVSWSLENIGMNEAYFTENQGPRGNVNVKVALLSTGVDYNHEDLIGQISVNRDEITEAVDINPSINYKDDDNNGIVDDIVGWDVVENDGLAFDRHGAGTAVAGIIAAKANGYGVRGMMDKVNIFPVRYINENGQSDVSKLVAALDVAIENSPDVVFLQSIDLPSAGGVIEDPNVFSVEKNMLYTVLRKYEDTEIPIVVAAGENLSEFEDLSFGQLFSRSRNVFVVTSTDKKGKLSLLANRGERSVIVAAPGEKVLTTGLNNSYEEVRGTAFAAAHVTGAFALAKAKHGDSLKIKHIRQVLSSSKSQTPSEYIEYQVRSGGVLNIPKFMSSLDELLK